MLLLLLCVLPWPHQPRLQVQVTGIRTPAITIWEVERLLFLLHGLCVLTIRRLLVLLLALLLLWLGQIGLHWLNRL